MTKPNPIDPDRNGQTAFLVVLQSRYPKAEPDVVGPFADYEAADTFAWSDAVNGWRSNDANIADDGYASAHVISQAGEVTPEQWLADWEEHVDELAEADMSR